MKCLYQQNADKDNAGYHAMNRILILFLSISPVMIDVDFSLAEVKSVSGKSAKRSFHYQYSSNDRRDPFRSIVEHVRPTVRNDSVKSTSESIDSQWKLLGIVSGSSGSRAVIQFGKEKRYVVSHGDVLRQENVRVVRLTSSTVTLEPLEKTNIGNKRSQSQSLELSFMK